MSGRVRPRRSRMRAVTMTSDLRRPTAVLAAIEIDLLDYAEELAIQRPRTRGECVDSERPCPWVGCRYHLYLDINAASGAIKLVFPDLDPSEIAHSCALDVADRGGAKLQEVGNVLNVTRERSRQLEVKALFAAHAVAHEMGLESNDVAMFPHTLPNAATPVEGENDARRLTVRKAHVADGERRRAKKECQ